MKFPQVDFFCIYYFYSDNVIDQNVILSKK